MANALTMTLFLVVGAAGCERVSSTADQSSQAASNPAVGGGSTSPSTYPVLSDQVIASTDTVDMLRTRHGADEVFVSEEGVYLFPGDSTRRMVIQFDDTGRPVEALVFHPDARWQRADGVRVGLKLTELAERNEAPISFMGFSFDNFSSVTGWNGGRLQHDPPLGEVRLCAPDSAQSTDPGYPGDEVEYGSTLPWVAEHPPTVCGFTVNLSPLPASEPAP